MKLIRSKLVLSAFCCLFAMLVAGCRVIHPIDGAGYQLPKESNNGLLMLTYSYDAPEGGKSKPKGTPGIAIEAVFEQGDSFATRYAKVGAAPLSWLYPPKATTRGNKTVFLFANEWPAGNYIIIPTINEQKLTTETTISFKPRKITVVGGKIVYGGNFHFSILKGQSRGISVTDEFTQDMELFRSTAPNVSGNEAVKDIREPN